MNRVLVLCAVAAAVLAGCSSSGSKDGSPTAVPTETPVVSEAGATGTPSPTVTSASTVNGIPVQPLRPADPVPFPSDIVLYALDGTWEGPTAALRRYYRDPTGVMRTDDLLVSTYAATGEATRGVVGMVGGPVASQLAAGLCHGTCYGELQPVTVVLSEDGGISWQDVGTLAKGSWGSVVATTGGRALVREFEPGQDEPLRTLPAASAPSIWSFPPDVAPNAAITTATVKGKLTLVALGNDERTLWNLDGSGTPLVRIPFPAGVRARPGLQLLPHGNFVELHVRWTNDPDSYFGLLDVDAGNFRAIYRYRRDQGLSGISVTEWLTDTVALGRGTFEVARYIPSAPPGLSSSVPAIIDFKAGTVSPITEFVHFLARKAGGPVPLAIARGPFARVFGTGDCLNVRAQPAQSSLTLGCFKDGVLLRLRPEPEQTADGATWLAVATPDVRSGWASAEFLER